MRRSAWAAVSLVALLVWKKPTNAVGWAFALVGLVWATGDLATAELAAVVGETVQPAHVSLWLREPGGIR